MDNITHSLTGALAAKMFETRGAQPDPPRQRALFWVLVVSANLPDIDVLSRFFGEPLYPLQFHRGLTHSFLLAPLLAILPSAVGYYWGKIKDFRTLWIASLVGITLHIFFDLITAFGTQIFAPLSAARFSLDSMFIIDPLFTVVIAAGLALARFLPRHRRRTILGSGAFVLAYVGLQMISHAAAEARFDKEIRRRDISPSRISVLAQPLSILHWMGLVQTREGVLQTFFNVWPGADSLELKTYGSSNDEFVRRARETDEARWFLRFARHPWILSVGESSGHIVEFRDLQFTIDDALLRSVGIVERSTPFVLRYVFQDDGTIAEVSFDRRMIRNNRHGIRK